MALCRALPLVLLLLLLAVAASAPSSAATPLVRLLSVEACRTGNASQRWVRYPSGDQQGDYRLQLGGSTLCAVLNHSAGEQTLRLAACSAGEKDDLQLWADSTDPRAGKGFVCAASSRIACDGGHASLPCCLSIDGGSSSVHAPVNLYQRCTNGPPCINQQWHSSSNDTSQHLVAADGFCLTAGAPSAPLPPSPSPQPPPTPPASEPYAPAPPYRDSALDCAVRSLAFTMALRSLANNTGNKTVLF